MTDLLTDVSRETFDLLRAYAKLVEKWNPKINLVSKASLGDLWERHILDSVQVVQTVEPKGYWVDLGSGGGFPGIVAAIFAQNTGAQVDMVESDQRKSAFLRTVIRELDLPAEVHTDRIEALQPLNADILSARALSDLGQLLEFSDLHLRKGGIAVFPKGARWRAELAEAEKKWSFNCTPVTSKTNPEAAILKIEDIQRV